MLLSLDAATVRFGGRAVLDAVGLDVAEHEVVCVLGPSGSGKSTLLRAVAGLQPLSGGRILLDGRDQAGVPAHQRGVGLMFQDHQLFPQRDVGANVAFGLRMHGVAKGERDAEVGQLLELVGLPGAARRAVASLSGGEQQRVALARALAPRPRLLVCDEPVSALDVSVQAQVLDLLRDLQASLGLAMLFISHDLAVVREICSRVLVMKDGQVVESGPVEEVFSAPRHPYTRALLEAVPRRARAAQERL